MKPLSLLFIPAIFIATIATTHLYASYRVAQQEKVNVFNTFADFKNTRRKYLDELYGPVDEQRFNAYRYVYIYSDKVKTSKKIERTYVNKRKIVEHYSNGEERTIRPICWQGILLNDKPYIKFFFENTRLHRHQVPVPLEEILHPPKFLEGMHCTL